MKILLRFKEKNMPFDYINIDKYIDRSFESI